MTYQEAQTEFYIRLHHWRKTALEKEIQEGFPRFRNFNNHASIRCRFFETLGKDSQDIFMRGLSQTRHQLLLQTCRQPAANTLVEEIPPEFAVLARREEDFQREYAIALWKSLSSSGIERTLAKSRERRKAIKAHFRAAFGDKCLPPDPYYGNDVVFQIPCNGWIIVTYFYFGRWEPEISYHHNIWTGKLVTKDEPDVFLGSQLNYGNEIGIGSGWQGIAVEDVDRTCLAVVEHCRIIFDALPELLKGLDLHLLTK